MNQIDPIQLLIRVPVVLLALTVHEFCHAYFAYRMGDPTAMRLGRCSLNPIRHLDPLGTLCLMFAPIGWAKPVPINPINFTDYRKGVLVSTAAGPGSNLVQALLFALVLRGLIFAAHRVGSSASAQTGQVFEVITVMVFLGVLVNVGLAVFNCLPLYPLDGFHITLQLMRPESQERFAQTAHYGPFVILGIVVIENAAKVDILGGLIKPPTLFILKHVAGVSFSS